MTNDNSEYIFYKTSTWSKAGGEFDIDPDTDYVLCQNSPYEVVVSTAKNFEVGYSHEGLNAGPETRYSISDSKLEIMLTRKESYNLISEEDACLKLSEYCNDFDLLVYDSKAKKTTRYQVIEVDKVKGYHPILESVKPKRKENWWTLAGMLEELLRIWPEAKGSLLYELIEKKELYKSNESRQEYVSFEMLFKQAVIDYDHAMSMWGLWCCDPTPEVILAGFISDVKKAMIKCFDEQYVDLVNQISVNPYNSPDVVGYRA